MILDLSSVTCFGRNQLSIIWQTVFIIPQESCFIFGEDFFVQAEEADTSYNTYFCMDLDFLWYLIVLCKIVFFLWLTVFQAYIMIISLMI